MNDWICFETPLDLVYVKGTKPLVFFRSFEVAKTTSATGLFSCYRPVFFLGKP